MSLLEPGLARVSAVCKVARHRLTPGVAVGAERAVARTTCFQFYARTGFCLRPPRSRPAVATSTTAMRIAPRTTRRDTSSAVRESSLPPPAKNEGGGQGQNPSQAIPTHHRDPRETVVTDPRAWSGDSACSQGKEMVDRGRIELPTPGCSVGHSHVVALTHTFGGQTGTHCVSRETRRVARRPRSLAGQRDWHESVSLEERLSLRRRPT